MQRIFDGSVAAATLPIPRDLLRRARITATYLARHGRLPEFDAPKTFTQWVQWRKLHDCNAAMPAMIDKLRAKHIVAEQLGREWTIPTLWHGRDLPPRPPVATPFVVKSRHGCNQRAFFRNPAELTPRRWERTRRAAQRWLAHDYGTWLDEWAYAQVPRGVIVERFVGSANGTLPLDYKVYVFGGEPAFVQVHFARETAHAWGVFDTAWRPVTRGMPAIAAPHSLPAMLDAARTLGRGFDFVRADFYEVDRRPLFGELTFYPGSGLDRFDPPELDAAMGALWAGARTARANRGQIAATPSLISLA